ncbi:MAG: tetratricopeptide repeat protein, partial [Planctomycetota bacterium]
GVLKQVVKADSDNVDAYRFLAGYYIESGRHQEAADALRQVVRIEPTDAHALLMLGDIYSDCGRHEDAMAAYRQAANRHADNAQAHYQLGEAYLQMGEKDLALEQYDILRSLDKQSANELLRLIHEQSEETDRQSAWLDDKSSLKKD